MTPLEIFFLAIIFLLTGIVVSMSIALRFWVSRVASLRAQHRRMQAAVDDALATVNKAEKRMDAISAKPQVWPGVVWPDTIEEKEQ